MKKRYSFKQLQQLAKEQNMELTKFKEEGMIKPVYVLDGDWISYGLAKWLITHEL